MAFNSIKFYGSTVLKKDNLFKQMAWKQGLLKVKKITNRGRKNGKISLIN